MDSPTEAGSRASKPPHLGWAAGSLSSPLAFRGQRSACTTNPNLYHTPLLPGAGLCTVAAQSVQTRLEGGSSRAKALSCQGLSGAARPQTAKLPHDGHAHRGSLVRAAEAQLAGHTTIS